MRGVGTQGARKGAAQVRERWDAFRRRVHTEGYGGGGGGRWAREGDDEGGDAGEGLGWSR